MIDVQRQELKYLVNTEQIAVIKKRMSQILLKDTHGGSNGYTIRSLYFDSLEDRDFHEKLDGLDARKKIRLRTYGDGSGVIKLELKEKENSLQRKRSLFLTSEEAMQMIRRHYGFLLQRTEPLAQQLYGIMVCQCYLPRCIVEYERLAFVHPASDIRITLDMNLRASESNLNLLAESLPTYPVQDCGFATLEVKFNGFLPPYIRTALSMVDVQPVSNSKYCRARMISKKGFL